MTTLTKKEGALTPFRREMERFFDEFPRMSWPAWMEKEEAFAPAVEVGETDDEFFVKAQVPGLKREELEVEVMDGGLTIKGEAKEEKEEKKKNYYRREFSYGSFARTIPIPPGADATKASADLKDGVLSVHVPKTDESKKRSMKLNID